MAKKVQLCPQYVSLLPINTFSHKPFLLLQFCPFLNCVITACEGGGATCTAGVREEAEVYPQLQCLHQVSQSQLLVQCC